jgi:hypothetical protein
VAHYDRNCTVSAGEPLSHEQLLALLDPAAADHAERTTAVACFLSRGDGWEQAAERLRGAFAPAETKVNR